MLGGISCLYLFETDFSIIILQLVSDTAAGPSQDEEARQASAQELQSLRDSLGQAQNRSKELEGQLENISKVKVSSLLEFL